VTTAPTDTPPPEPAADFWAAPTRVATIAAVAGLAVYGIAGVVYMSDPHNDGHHAPAGATQFLLAWQAGWTFWASLPLGGLALLMIHYLAKTSWGLMLRRPLEAAALTLPLMIVLFLPTVAGLVLDHGRHSQYWWVNPDHDPPAAPVEAKRDLTGDKDIDAYAAKREERLAASAEQVKKAVAHERHARQKGTWNFLSVPAFIGVAVVCFAIWYGMILYLTKLGAVSDAATGTPAEKWEQVDAAREKLNRFSGPGLIVFALTTTVACTQWVMSLEAGWASTMFPVIYAVNQFLTCFAFCVAAFLFLVGREPFKGVIRPKFQLDMGSLMLAFTLFWSYTSFSQMMLIWIGNLPEEIPFYLKRSAPGWWAVSAGLILFHFAVPFLLMLFRDVKLHPARLRAMATYLLVVCAVDVVWWVEPTYPHHGPLYVLMDAGAVIGIGGVWGLVFLGILKKRPLFPVNEQHYLPEGHGEHH
jgi:hypothetical protein